MTVPSIQRVHGEQLEAQLRRLGLVLLPAGGAPAPAPGDWLRLLVDRSPFVARGIARMREHGADDRLGPVEAVPGLRLHPVRITGRRGRPELIAILVVPTSELARSEHLHALCDAAGLDHASTRSLLQALVSASEDEAERIAGLACALVQSEHRLGVERAAVESLGHELGATYEEINLLYTTVRNMTEVEQPDRFVSLALAELRETMRVGWTAAVMASDSERLRRLSGRVLVSGTVAPEAALRSFASELVHLGADGANVLGHAALPNAMLGLGLPAAIVPIRLGDGIVAGAFVAGEKSEDDGFSSSDLKLMTATAGHTAIFLENAALYDDLNATILGTLEALTASIDAKDPYTCGHSHRVALLVRQLAEAIGLDGAAVASARIAGLVHDVGKIGVPEAVLTKPGRLSDEEFAWIRRHPEIGHRILRDIPQFRDILPGVLHHHERWDGRGYPAGLAEEEIPLFARIIALADSFDAMSSNRTYRARLDRASVMEEIRRSAGRQFDPALVPVFLGLDFAEFDALIAEHQRSLPRDAEAQP